ncbi:MAG: PAS domain-containing protein [Alphaproteobacteria bacterium]
MTAPAQTDATPRAGRLVIIAGAVLAVIAVLGIIGVFRFVAAERARDLAAWQVRLGIVADSRAAAVTAWLDAQAATLRELAENASLQLYFTELTLADGDRDLVTEEAAQADYLRNLLVATADRAGFAAPPLGAQVKANVERIGIAGLALTDADGEVLVATPGMPPLAGRLANWLGDSPREEPGTLDLFLGADGKPAMAFVAPIFSLQGDNTAADVVGRVVGLRPVGPSFQRTLRQPGDVDTSAETLLVRRDGATVTYLSPLADGTEALKRTLAANTPELAAAILLDSPGGFGLYRDYRGVEVLATSRAIAGAPWVLIRKIDRDAALAETDRRLTVLLTVLLLSIGVALAAIVAVWRHGTSVRAAQAAERYRVSTERFENLWKFIRLVTDSQPNQIFAVDNENQYTFANYQAAARAGLEADEMMGKSMAAVLGPARAGALEEINRQVIATGETRSEVHAFATDGDKRHVVKSDHIPLHGDRDHPPGALVIVEDITELVEERERGERIMRQVVDTLVTLVDRRDPFSAHHAQRVAEVAREIAQEMDLDAAAVDTVDIAGSLINLGKVVVPSEILTKQGALTAEELSQVRGSIIAGAELLRGIDFQGPVVDTLRQTLEHWDGTGAPAGLAGEDILITARVLAVANAFAGMVSARAHRPGLDFDAAEQALMADVGKAFDRRPVAALLNVLDNRGGRERWAAYREPPALA